MQIERRVTLFTDRGNQTLPIPREFELPGTEAIIRKEGDRLIVEPLAKPSLLSVLARLEPLDEVFPDIADPVPTKVDL